MTAVRRGTGADVEAAARVLANAFADHPWTRWTVDAHEHRSRLEGIQRLCLAELALPFGEFTVAEEDGDLLGAAIWMPTDVVPPEVWRAVVPAVATLVGDRARAVAVADAALAPLRTRAPHVALESLGVAPEHQGRGVGSALVVHGLRRADHAGLPVRLETSAPANIPFYQRLRFAVTGELGIPGGGPRVWSMGRAPGDAPHKRHR